MFTVMALQEAKSTLGKGSMQKLRQDEKRKVRRWSRELTEKAQPLACRPD